jgi:hypothetical protein
MTLNQLHKITGKLIAEGYGRRPVCVDKSKVTHPLENDGCCIIHVTEVRVLCHEMLDEDGSTAYRNDGTGIFRTSVVIEAEN